MQVVILATLITVVTTADIMAEITAAALILVLLTEMDLLRHPRMNFLSIKRRHPL